MMRENSVVKNLWMAVILSLMLAFSASVSWAEVGVTDDEIRIGCTADLSGPIAFMGKQVTEGAQIYFDYINDRGGVFGRKLKLLVEDDGYQSPRAVMGCKKLVTKDKVFCMFMVLGSAQSNAIYPFLESRGIPLICPASQNRALVIPPRKGLFLADTTYTEQGKIAIEYTVESLGVKQPKVACIYQDDTPGHDWLRGIKIGCKHYGFDVLGLSYKRGSVDFSAQVAKCKHAGITHVYLWTLVREPAMIMKEAQRVQYKATYITALPSMQNIVLKLAGDAVDYTNGFYGTGLVYSPVAFESPDSALHLYAKNNAKYGPNDLDSSNYAYGYTNAVNLVEGLFRAGPDLTREGLIKALETFDTYYNGLGVPITWGPDRRDGGRGTCIGKAENGEWVQIEDQFIYSTIEEH